LPDDAELNIAVITASLKFQSRRYNKQKLLAVYRDYLERRSPHAGFQEPHLVVLPPYPITGVILGLGDNERNFRLIKQNAERLVIDQGYTVQFVYNSILKPETHYVLAGPIFERAGPRLFNTMALFAPYYEDVERYRKIAVTSFERMLRVTPGKKMGVFQLRITPKDTATIGVFTENDLFYPEIFRLMSLMNAWIAIGTYTPAPHLPLVVEGEEQENDNRASMFRVDVEELKKVVSVRARESGIPILLIGGAIKSVNNDKYISYAPTIIADPESGVVKTYDLDDLDKVHPLSVSQPEEPTCDETCEDVLYMFLRETTRLRNQGMLPLKKRG